MNDGQWLKAAACRDVPTGLFYPERGDKDTETAAINVCAGCRVRLVCLDESMTHPLGIQGGWPAEIRTITRRLGHPCPWCEALLPPIAHHRMFCDDMCLLEAMESGGDRRDKLMSVLERMGDDASEWNRQRREAYRKAKRQLGDRIPTFEQLEMFDWPAAAVV